MIFQIIIDIKNFMIVYTIAVFGIAYMFWVISYCQVEEGVDPDDIEYITLDKSFYWSWNIGLGLSSTESFMHSDGLTRHFLMALFLASTFIINVLLLNLLIAIMGDTFSQQANITELILVKDHLQFIIDNWYLAFLSIKRKNYQYIFVAFKKDDLEMN